MERSGRTISIAVYKPKPGMEDKLLELSKKHLDILRIEGLATDRCAILGKASDGSFVEVFEWKDGGIEAAHQNSSVGLLWAEYAEACEFVPLSSLEESRQMFAGFTPIDL